MRNKTRKNGPSRSDVRKKPDPASPQHTAREREKMRTGLRILARIIARAHLRRQASRTASAPPPEQEAGY